jgi:hypothetical protein
VFVGVAVGVTVDVLVGIKVVVAVGAIVARRLGTTGRLFRPNHSQAPMAPKSRIAARMPYDRKLLPVFLISGCEAGGGAWSGCSINLLSI